MVWCRAGIRSENLSVYTDFFTSYIPLQTAETRMQYTMCVCPAWASGIEDTKLFQRVKDPYARIRNPKH
jgi:hypothetical protein